MPAGSSRSVSRCDFIRRWLTMKKAIHPEGDEECETQRKLVSGHGRVLLVERKCERREYKLIYDGSNGNLSWLLAIPVACAMCKSFINIVAVPITSGVYKDEPRALGRATCAHDCCGPGNNQRRLTSTIRQADTRLQLRANAGVRFSR